MYIKKRIENLSNIYMKLLPKSSFVQLYKIIISHEQTGYLLES
jgi:hypothetical protein